MSESNEGRLDRLHRELARLYRSGVTDRSVLDSFWVRIDRLEDAIRREGLLRRGASDES